MVVNWIIIGGVVFAAILAIWYGKQSEEDRKVRARIEEENRLHLINQIEEKVLNNPEVKIENWEELKTQCINGTISKVSQIDKYIDRLIYLYKEYKTDEIVNNILEGICTLGMDEYMIREIKGSPNKIDEEILKTKTKRIYIYGNKSSGDVLTFENGLLVKIIDR